MGILGFLFGLGCLVLIAWAIASSTDATAIALVIGAVFGRKRQQQNRPQQPPSLTPPETQERNSLQSIITAPLTPALHKLSCSIRLMPLIAAPASESLNIQHRFFL